MFKKFLSRLFRRKQDVLVKPASEQDVDAQYVAIEAKVAAENAGYGDKLANLYPNGFFRLQTKARGEVLAHWCSKCKTISDPVGPVVRHCGRTEQRPVKLKSLPTAQPTILI